MQCHTLDESLSSPPQTPVGGAVCEDKLMGGLKTQLAEFVRRSESHDTHKTVWDTGRPDVDMSSRPFMADSAVSPDETQAPASAIEAPGDNTVADALRAGDGRAIAQLFDRYGAHIERVLVRTIGRDTEMEDMVQDVFLGAYRSGPNYQGNDEQLKAWVSRIAVFTARGYLRKRKRKWWLRSSDPGQMPEQSSREPSPHTAEVLRRTYAALAQMDAELRIPFALRELESMELAEIADSCDCSLSTIKRRLARARKAFVRLAKKDPILRDWLGDEN